MLFSVWFKKHVLPLECIFSNEFSVIHYVRWCTSALAEFRFEGRRFVYDERGTSLGTSSPPTSVCSTPLYRFLKKFSLPKMKFSMLKIKISLMVLQQFVVLSNDLYHKKGISLRLQKVTWLRFSTCLPR